MKIKGITDEQTTCDRCGKANLKSTFIVESQEGDVFFLGSDCVKKRFQLTQKELTAAVDHFIAVETEQAAAEYAQLAGSDVAQIGQIQRTWKPLENGPLWKNEAYATLCEKANQVRLYIKAKYPQARFY